MVASLCCSVCDFVETTTDSVLGAEIRLLTTIWAARSTPKITVCVAEYDSWAKRGVLISTLTIPIAPIKSTFFTVRCLVGQGKCDDTALRGNLADIRIRRKCVINGLIHLAAFANSCNNVDRSQRT